MPARPAPPRRIFRWLAVAIVAACTALGLTALGGTPVGSTGAAGVAGDGSLTDPNVQFYGRWDRDDAAWYQMGWAGGYVETAFSGSSIGVRLRGAIDLWYSIDGGAAAWMRAAAEDVTIRSGLTGAHTIRVGFRERAGAYEGDPAFGGFLLAEGGATAVTARPAAFIEFIGDSITVGEPNGDRPFTTYGYLVGEGLDAGHTQVAQGGACLVATAGGCYGMTDGFHRSSSRAATDDWDFSRYRATAVVVNLGTNDDRHDVPAATFQRHYIELLERVRQAYPDAQIFAMETFRGVYSAETRTAVAARTDAGDSQVHFVDTTGWLPEASDMADSLHPSDAGHRKIADRLAPVLARYL